MSNSVQHKLARALFGVSMAFCVTMGGYVVWYYQYAERANMRKTAYRDAEKIRLKEHTKKMAELEQVYRKQEEDILKEKNSNK